MTTEIAIILVMGAIIIYLLLDNAAYDHEGE
jgi:hypothetical protein